MIKDKLSISQVMTIKKMGLNGLVYAKVNHPDLGIDELAELERLIRLHTPNEEKPAFSYDEHRHAFICAAWLLGASQAQLGRKLRIAQQTACRHLDRGLRDIPDRNAVRLKPPPMPVERLETLFETFYGMCKLEPVWYKQLSMIELASIMNNFPDKYQPEPDETEDDYDKLPDQTRRIASEEQRTQA